MSIKKKYKVEGMDCPSCSAMLELDLEDLGVKAKCSYPKQELEVEFDPKIVDLTKIINTVQKSGYKLV